MLVWFGLGVRIAKPRGELAIVVVELSRCWSGDRSVTDQLLSWHEGDVVEVSFGSKGSSVTERAVVRCWRRDDGGFGCW